MKERARHLLKKMSVLGGLATSEERVSLLGQYSATVIRNLKFKLINEWMCLFFMKTGHIGNHLSMATFPRR